MMKILRVLTAAAVFSLTTFFFLGFGSAFGWLAKFQLIPALLACSVVPLAFWAGATMLAGRIYCSWFCPLGILQDLLSRVFGFKGARRFAPRADRPWMRFGALVAFAGLLAVGGTAVAGIYDPYSMYGRIAVNFLQPCVDWLSGVTAKALGDGAGIFGREALMRGAFGIAVSGCALGALAALTAWRGRVFCNTVCPAGAILATLAKRSTARLVVDKEKCIKCGMCSKVCKAECLDGKAGELDNARCVRCMNCVKACPKGAIGWRTVWNIAGGGVDAGRRAFLANTAAGAAATGAAIVGGKAVGAGGGSAVPPPCTSEENLRRKCVGCGLCVARCTERVLTPAGAGGYGALGVLMPEMKFDKGWCVAECSECGKACPTGAIPRFAAEEKKKARGVAAEWDGEKCLVKKEGIECGLCERRCAYGAITLKEEGKKKLPVVDAAKCTGCGACELHCPSKSFRVKPVRG